MYAERTSYSWDLETDTSPDENGVVNGLRPLKAPITEIAFACDESVMEDGGTVWSGAEHDEGDMIVDFFDTLADLPPGVHDTWNGIGFDIGYIYTRATLLGLNPVRWMTLSEQPGLVTRRPPVEPFEHPVSATFVARVGEHQHFDVSTVYLRAARALGIQPGLKSVAIAYGLEPIEVDRERMQDLTPGQRRDYAMSDAYVTRLLGMHARGLDVSEIDDPLLSGAPGEHRRRLSQARYERLAHDWPS